MAKDYYGSFGSVSDLKSSSGPAQPYQNISASPDAFGANVGQATQYQGKVMQKIGEDQLKMATEAAQQATEAKHNDEYARVFVPKAMELREAYDSAPDNQKVHAYEAYVRGIDTLGQQFMGDDRGVYEKQLWQNTISKQVASETEYAKRELYASQKAFSADAANARLLANNGLASANYNNPALVEDVIRNNNATLELQLIDDGHDLSDPTVQGVLQQAQDAALGDTAYGMINSAVSRGDVETAYKLRTEYGSFMPGHKQEEIDSVVFTQANRQNAVNGAKAIMEGKPLPPSPIGPQNEVQAVVADTAEAHGVDPNHALTVAWIESSMGANVGKRGDIGQTGKGGDLPTQAANMITMLKDAERNAAAALGRQPTRWESYLCYQQGAGGGPALLKAARDMPTARAVDVLRPLYKNPENALSAIIHNGGNASMTAGDFLALIERKYQKNADQADCILPSGEVVSQPSPEGVVTVTAPGSSSLGEALRSQGQKQGEAVQPAPSPSGYFDNFEAKYPAMVARINAEEPNRKMREMRLAGLNEMRGQARAQKEAYLNGLDAQAEKLIYNDSFTSMDQVPPDLAAALQRDNPKKYRDLKLGAIKNRGGDDNPLAIGELNLQVNSLFAGGERGTTDIPAGKLDDAVRLQDEILRKAEAGEVSGETARSLVKSIEIGLGSISDGRRDIGGWIPDHYKTAFQSFQKSGASPVEVNRMFRDYVAASDKLKFDQMPVGWWGKINAPKDQSPQQTPEGVIGAILNDQKASKYAAVGTLKETPNAVIGSDGTSVTSPVSAPQGKPNTNVGLTQKRMRDKSGAEAIVTYNAKGEVINIEEIK